MTQGHNHSCNKRSQQENLFQLVREASTGTKQIVASRLIDSICEDNDVDKTSGTLTLKTRGTSKVINIGRPKVKMQFTTEDLLKIKTNFNFSGKKIKELAQALRVVLGRNAVESSLRERITEKNAALANFFTMKMLPTIRKIGDKETIEMRPYTFARDLPALIHVLLDIRGIDPDHHEVLLGADDGQQSLKVRKIFINN